jgi:recombinational DNA repair protein RecT
MASSLLSSVKPIEIFDIAEVRNNFIAQYQRCTGKQDGELRFEAERLAFIKKFQENDQLGKCSQVSIYSTFIDLSVSGLSLIDDEAYIIPYSKGYGANATSVATFQIGYRGRLKQISVAPGVKYVKEPKVVYSDETFEYSVIDGSYKVTNHVPKVTHEEGAQIVAVYCYIQFEHGLECYLMTRQEVLEVRAFSQSWKQYEKDLKDAVNGKITRKGNNGTYEADLKEPMWKTNEPEAFKKTLIKRMYKYVPKTKLAEALDKKVSTVLTEVTGAPQHDEPDPEDIFTSAQVVDEESGEIFNQQ